MISSENCIKSVPKTSHQTSHFFRNASLLEAMHFLSHIDFSRSVNPIRSSLLQRFFLLKLSSLSKHCSSSNPCSLLKHFSLLKHCSFSKCSSLYRCFSLIETLPFSYFIHCCSYNSRSHKIAIKQYKKVE